MNSYLFCCHFQTFIQGKKRSARLLCALNEIRINILVILICFVQQETIDEVVLLVDDEAHIIETGQVVLESLGYQVVMDMDGDQAVNIYKANADQTRCQDHFCNRL